MKTNLPKKLLTAEQFKKFAKGKHAYIIFISRVQPARSLLKMDGFLTKVPLVQPSRTISIYEKDCSASGAGFWELERWSVSYNRANKRYMITYRSGRRA